MHLILLRIPCPAQCSAYNTSAKIRLLGLVGISVVDIANVADGLARAVHEHARRIHKVRIARNVRLLIHPAHNLLQERPELHIRIRLVRSESEFRDPDRTTSGDCARRIDVILEIARAGIDVAVPMHIYEIKSAAVAGLHELSEPC